MNETPQGMGFAATVVESTRQTLLRLVRRRLWFLVVGGAAILFGIAWLLGARADDDVSGRELFCMLAWWLLATVLLPWTTLWLGVQTVHGALEDRTFQYLFLRPVARSALLLGNWIAVAVASAAAGALGMVGLFGGFAWHEGRWPDGLETGLRSTFVMVAVLIAVAYSAAAMVFSTLTRRPLLWAALFVVGVQMLTANLPVSAGLRRLTITDPLRRFVFDRVEPGGQLAEMLWPNEGMVGDAAIGEPLRDLALLTAVCLVLAVYGYCRSEYDARPRE